MSKNRKQSSMMEQRLKNSHPAIYADLAAGRIPSLKKALVKAGLISRPGPADKLLKNWAKANAEERAQFLVRIGAIVSSQVQPPVPDVMSQPIANGRYLLPHAIDRLEKIILHRQLSPEDIMRQAGFASQGRALTRALARKSSLRLAVIAALEQWLRQQEKPD